MELKLSESKKKLRSLQKVKTHLLLFLQRAAAPREMITSDKFLNNKQEREEN